jgi:hypothetical protein
MTNNKKVLVYIFIENMFNFKLYLYTELVDESTDI